MTATVPLAGEAKGIFEVLEEVEMHDASGYPVPIGVDDALAITSALIAAGFGDVAQAKAERGAVIAEARDMVESGFVYYKTTDEREALVVKMLAALDAATLTSDEDQMYVKRMEAERDAALGKSEHLSDLLGHAMAQSRMFKAERDAALAALEAIR